MNDFYLLLDKTIFSNNKKNKFFYLLEDNNLDKYYFNFRIKKKKGGYRYINSPSKDLLYFQRKIYFKMLEYDFVLPDYVVGGVRGKSIVSNASFHVSKKYLLNIDIKDFFTSIVSEMIRKKFENHVSNIDLFLKFVTYNGYLPQGSPTSTIISNIIFNSVDIKIIDYFKNKKFSNIGYSRYIDDISISFDNLKEKPNIIINDLKEIIFNEGFNINEKKIFFYNNLKRMTVTGITVNKKVSYPKYLYKILRSIIFNLLNNGYGYFPKIKGYLSYLKNIDINKYESLKKNYFKKFNNNKVYFELFDMDMDLNEKKGRPIGYSKNLNDNDNDNDNDDFYLLNY